MNKREFTELLKGCRLVKDKDGNVIVQSIMNMQVVCLTTDKEYSLDERFANPLTAVKASNRSYGQVSFANSADKEVILPVQSAIMTKQSAQNHGMIKAGYLSKKANVTYHDAGCVQGSQCGTFRDTQEFRMIPVTMREMLFDSVGQGLNNLGRIYPAIEKLGRDTKSNSGNYLNIYFDKYDKKLEQFIAHFERPKNLIGIIVLIDGEIVAIDKFPSFTYAEQVWDLMIRDCYGALAIISELKNKTSWTEFTIALGEVERTSRETEIVALFELALQKTKQKITASVTEKLQELLSLEFDATVDAEGHSTGTNTPKSYILKNEGYVGQVIMESDFNHMVSVVKRERFNPEALRAINELRNKARRQERFGL